jgi:hypothetical protein
MSTMTTETAEPSSASRYARLRRWNLIVGLVFLVQVVVIAALSNNLSFPISIAYLGSDPIAAQVPATPHVVFRIGVGLSVAIFLACAAVDHLLTGGPLRRWYERQLDRRANYARWIEYTFSSSVMIVLIATLVGARDLAAVLGVIAANSAMILFGLLMERQQSPGRTDWSAFWFGSVVGLVPWVIVLIYIAGAPRVPGFVYVITLVQFLLFFSFAANMALQYLQVGRWKDYVYGEYGYIVLSLAAKTLLAWLIFGNVLRA